MVPTNTKDEPTPHQASDETAGEHLKSLVEGVFSRINNRGPANQVSTTDPEFDFIDPTFSAVPGPPFAQIPITWPEYLARFNELLRERPDYAAAITGISYAIHKNGTTGEVFVNFEIMGAPEGIVRRAVGIFRFAHSREGKWLCARLSTLDGLEGTETTGI